MERKRLRLCHGGSHKSSLKPNQIDRQSACVRHIECVAYRLLLKSLPVRTRLPSSVWVPGW
jgi:hypothetical protein